MHALMARDFSVYGIRVQQVIVTVLELLLVITIIVIVIIIAIVLVIVSVWEWWALMARDFSDYYVISCDLFLYVPIPIPTPSPTIILYPIELYPIRQPASLYPILSYPIPYSILSYPVLSYNLFLSYTLWRQPWWRGTSPTIYSKYFVLL